MSIVVIVLWDGKILGGTPYFWSTGSCTFQGKHLQGKPMEGRSGRQPAHSLSRQHGAPVFVGGKVATGFSGTCRDGQSEVFGSSLAGPPKHQFSRDIASASGYLMASRRARLYTAPIERTPPHFARTWPREPVFPQPTTKVTRPVQ